MDVELKKCPFCGGIAKINEKYNTKTRLTFVEVTCLACGGRGKTAIYNRNYDCQKEQAYEAAVAAWNLRSDEKDEQI